MMRYRGKKKEKKSYEEEEEAPFVNQTVPGEKKDMSGEMASGYDPRAVESAWYEWWEAKGFFQPKERRQGAGTFVIVLPPPNVTGYLHLGHTLTGSIQDAVVRWKRMKGCEVLYLPGTDHAGIATQTVVERRLWNQEQKSRHDLGREAFLERVWQWKNEYGSRIDQQLRRLGSSLDWDRYFFTLDDIRAEAVQEAFIRMFNEGIIYRENRLVNWCCTLKTAISDIEVEYIDILPNSRRRNPGHDQSYDFGQLTSFAYRVEDSDEEIIVATTRPETILGDTGVAVHPEDPRYKHLHGKFVIHPFNQRRIPIVCDPVLVDMEFGTGAVKITPAHDPNDYECGKRHGLEFINILNDDGTLNANGYPYEGMKRFDVRTKIVKDLEEKGILRGVAGHAMRLGICSRSNDVIEPMLRPQWYVDCSAMAAQACEAVRNGDLSIVPEIHKDTWFRWLENIHPWCISRQLWWGHRIPAFWIYPRDGPIPDNSDGKYWFAARTEEEALQAASARLGVSADQLDCHQDPDVLDTWFSSGLLPFSGMGWPNESSSDLHRFFPGHLLETGHDILFFWVARMVMMSLFLTGSVPFHTVYLHSMVRDKQGRKMSKTLGNVVDPIDVIEGITLERLHEKLLEGNLDAREVERAKKGQTEQFPDGISRCGTDGLRFALLSYTQQGRDINLDINIVVGYRQFCNKMWNATRFALINLAGFDESRIGSEISTEALSLGDKWILSRLSATAEEVNAAMEAYEFGNAVQTSFRFFLNDLCDVYIEVIKPILRLDDEDIRQRTQQVLLTCLDASLRMMHPFMPFVTEELWQRLPGRSSLPADECSIMIQAYPEPVFEWKDPRSEHLMRLCEGIVHAIRGVRDTYQVKPAQMITAHIRCSSPESVEDVQACTFEIVTLARCSSLDIIADGSTPKGCAISVFNEHIEIFILLSGLIDPRVEIDKLEKKMSKALKTLEGLARKMSIEGYENKVPENVRQQNAELKLSQELEVEKIREAIAVFESFDE